MARKENGPFTGQYVQSAELRKNRVINDFGYNPYPSSSISMVRTNTCASFNKNFANVEDSFDSVTVVLTGKIVLWRVSGKIIFGHIQDLSGERTQIFFSIDDTEEYDFPKKTMGAGDIISVRGYPFRTEKGELTLRVKKAIMVSKAMTPPPEKFHGLKDEETKYRNRHLHMLSDFSVVETLKTRAKIFSIIRRTFEGKGFIEQQTQVLQDIPGGANARPFVTHHNALDVERYLRIAPELQLKKLLIGGFEKVFEISVNFRNEGIDATHNPEFTSIEYYEAYATYKQHMKGIEKLFKKIYRKLFDNEEYKLPYGDLTIDLNNWTKISFKKALVEIGGIPKEVLKDVNALSEYLASKGSKKANNSMNIGQLWETAFDELVEDKIVDPTFITKYPIEISPLARKCDDDPRFTERFELFIAGREFANGFNELTDPLDQYNRFKAQVASKNLDDPEDESMAMDISFIEALMSGMPPAAGTGIGLDRLVMLFTNRASIKDVIAFPAMR